MVEPSVPRIDRFVWDVAALVHAVADTLNARFFACTVRGELSGFSKAGSGHCYFSLKDANGGAVLIRCAMFRRAMSLLNFAPCDGQQVELRGRLGVYEPRSELQFIVESMQPAGVGAQLEQFMKLKARLQAEGLFDTARKRLLPRFPQRVGVVTSLGAATLHDVLTTLKRRAPHVGVIVYPSLVQGVDAPMALVEAIQLAGRRLEVDVLIVCRGGGSLEDLWAFNDERVVRAIAACPMPLVCGVGHETDVTLADFVADLRAPTPTAAAELVAPARQNHVDVLAQFALRLSDRAYQMLDKHAQRLDRATLHFMRPADSLRGHAQRLALLGQRLSGSATEAPRRDIQRNVEMVNRLQRALQVALQANVQRLASMTVRLNGLDPRRILARGYAWVMDAQGQPVTTAASLARGQQFNAVMVDGQAIATVNEIVLTKVPDLSG